MTPIQLNDPIREQYLDLELSDGKSYVQMTIYHDCGSESFEFNKDNIEATIAFLIEARKELV